MIHSRMLVIMLVGLLLVSANAGVAYAMNLQTGSSGDLPGLSIVDQQSEEEVEQVEAQAEDFIDRLGRTPQNDIARVVLVAGGVLLLVLGWRIYSVIIVIAGALIGAATGINLVGDASTAVQFLALIIGGLVGAALGVFLYYVAVFLIGAYTGIALTAALASALDLEPVSTLALIAGALIGGFVLLAMAVELLIIFSAVVGAQMVALGLGLDALWVVLLAIIGIVVQVALARASDTPIRRRRT
ncbi:MAG: hypothetical protein ACOCX3_00530 [Chloroflexota bacterium]